MMAFWVDIFGMFKESTDTDSGATDDELVRKKI